MLQAICEKLNSNISLEYSMSLVPFWDGAFCLTHTPLNIDTCFNMPAFQFCPKGAFNATGDMRKAEF